MKVLFGILVLIAYVIKVQKFVSLADWIDEFNSVKTEVSEKMFRQ